MSGDFAVVDIRVGRFESGLQLHEYLDERPEYYQDDTESLSISAFAEEMGERFLDHDFACTMFVAESTPDITTLLRESLITNGFGDQSGERVGAEFIAARYLKIRGDAVNSVILMYNEEVAEPRSVQGSAYWLQYVGRFFEQ